MIYFSYLSEDMKKTTPFYRPILGQALHSAWHHRELWPFAALAGVAGIGAVVSDVLTQARLASSLPELHPFTSDISLSLVHTLLEGIRLGGSSAAIVMFCITLIGTILLAILVAFCQHLLLRACHRSAGSDRPLSLRELAKDATHPRLGRILLIDACTKILLFDLILVSGYALSFLQPTVYFFDGFFGLIFSVAAIFIGFTLNILGIFALLACVQHDMHAVRALSYAWKLLRTHATVCLEMALLLFVITFALSLVAIFGLIMIGTLSIPFFSMMYEAGTMMGFAVVGFLAALLAATWTIACAGCSTLFTYICWSELARAVAQKKSAAPSRLAHHSKRGFAALKG